MEERRNLWAIEEETSTGKSMKDDRRKTLLRNSAIQIFQLVEASKTYLTVKDGMNILSIHIPQWLAIDQAHQLSHASPFLDCPF
nr:hypothetical protein Iba_chr02cCG15830 [Ipomoea batatas]